MSYLVNYIYFISWLKVKTKSRLGLVNVTAEASGPLEFAESVTHTIPRPSSHGVVTDRLYSILYSSIQ